MSQFKLKNGRYVICARDPGDHRDSDLVVGQLVTISTNLRGSTCVRDCISNIDRAVMTDYLHNFFIMVYEKEIKPIIQIYNDTRLLAPTRQFAIHLANQLRGLSDELVSLPSAIVLSSPSIRKPMMAFPPQLIACGQGSNKLPARCLGKTRHPITGEEVTCQAYIPIGFARAGVKHNATKNNFQWYCCIEHMGPDALQALRELEGDSALGLTDLIDGEHIQ
jgi:hypothetical protein